MTAGLTLPTLTVADPPVSGEGSLDPLGMAALADRIADQLVPDVRARMSRVRFLTAMAVSSIVTDEVGDVLVIDGRATPSLVFEWLLLEGFVRKKIELPTGVPGITKARGVRSNGGRLGAGTYLKAPGVFGFNGVYKPLATGIDLVTDDLMPEGRASDLVAAWEREQNLPGFLSGSSSSAGGKLRVRLASAVRAAVDARVCAEPDQSPVWNELPHRLLPIGPGRDEARLLREWLTDHPIRGELARLIAPLEEGSDNELLPKVRDKASIDLRLPIDAALAYEAFTSHLEVAFRALLRRSTQLNSSPLTPAMAEELTSVREAAKVLPSLFTAAVDAVAPLGLHLDLERRLGAFAEPMTPTGLADALLLHHNQIQGDKVPHGKRPWFEPHGAGVVVRGPYRVDAAPERRPFVHPMRVWSLHQFLRDTAP